MTNYQAKILVASPMLMDPNFRQSVVLMLSGDDEESFGVIINRQSDKPVSEVWDAAFGRPCDLNQMIHIGGPVFGPLIALHTEKDIADGVVMPGLYISTKKDALETLVDDKIQPIRLFIGGSGWGKGQLEQEINQSVWYVIPAKISEVFDDPTELWKKALNRAGLGFLQSMIKRMDFPEDPTCN